MSKSMNGPDWIDVEMLMRAVSTMHGGKAGLTLLPRGIGSSGGIEVGASFLCDVVQGSSLEPAITIIKNWPCASHETLAGHCFAALHELDYAIGKVYRQETLW